MQVQPVVHYASRSDVGMRRSANQDSMVVRLCGEFEDWQTRGHLFVVADGMGGHSVGDLASRITVETLPLAFQKSQASTITERVSGAITAANQAVNDRGLQNPEFADMGTTCSLLSLSGFGAVAGHVGDSRVYRVRGGQIAQMTFDHSLQWEMIRLGRATVSNVDLFHPRNVITRCLGPDPHVKVDVEGPFNVVAGDRWILCSDGLTSHLSDSEIGQIAASLPPVEAAQLLINVANCRGGSDNSTVIVAEIESYPAIENTINETEIIPPSEMTDTQESDSQPGHQPNDPAAAAAVTRFDTSTLTGIVLVIAGAALLFAGFRIPGVLVLAAGPAVWLMRRILMNQAWPARKASAPSPAFKSLSSGPPPTIPADDGIRAVSPYRVTSCVLTDSLLDQLAEIQSELVQAAKDSGWEVDVDRLTELTRQSVSAQQGGRRDSAIQPRTQAIEILMKELYSRARMGKE